MSIYNVRPLHIHRPYIASVVARNFFWHPPEPPASILIHPPDKGIYIGQTRIFNVPFYWNPDLLVNPHIVVVGITGSGKSYFLKTFLTRAGLYWNSNALIFDWAGEYRQWVKETGGKIIRLGKGEYINLLDLGGMRPLDRIQQVMSIFELLTDVGKYPEQYRLIETAIERAYVEAGFKLDSREQYDELGRPLVPPTLKDVLKILETIRREGAYEYPAELENAVYKVRKFARPGQDFFAKQSTISLDEMINSGIVDVDLTGLPTEDFRAMAALTLLQFIKERMRIEGQSKGAIKLFVVLDEAWKISREENTDVVMIAREGRKYRFGLIVASQNPTDINQAIFSNVGTVFIFKVKLANFLNYLQGTLNFSNWMRQQISMLGVGQCAVNMAFSSPQKWPSTFLIERVVGAEPQVEYFIEYMEGGMLAVSLSIERDEFKHWLRSLGISEEKVVQISDEFEKTERHMNAIDFVMLLERYGIPRRHILQFFKTYGKVPDSTLINILAAVDQRKEGGDTIGRIKLEEKP